jgi:hypothetical protein
MPGTNGFPKILIGIPTMGSVRIEMMSSLIYVLMNTPAECALYTPISCYVHMNREEIVKKALQTEADYIFFVDTDMKFPQDTLTKLLSMNVDIVGAVYNQRKSPPTSVVIQLDPPVDRLPNEPIKVRAVGTGLLLVKIDVFKKMSRPWFFFEPELDDQKAVGEDVWFCDKAREMGYDIWIEPSIVTGHVGEVIF